MRKSAEPNYIYRFKHLRLKASGEKNLLRELLQLKEWNKTLELFNKITLYLSVMSVLLLIYNFGFHIDSTAENIIRHFLTACIWIFTLNQFSNILDSFRRKVRLRVRLFDFLFLIFLVFIIRQPDDAHLYPSTEGIIPALFNKNYWRNLALFIFLLKKIFELNIEFKNRNLNPALLFVSSFVSIILVGALMLMLPRSTHDGISFINALFTATSAVCVTGLIVVETGSYFTLFGQTIIIILVQIGGLGIMTFTVFFSHFFKGASSYKSRLLIGDLVSASLVTDVLNTVKIIIVVTFFFEGIGALLILHSLDNELMPNAGNRLFFSVFHSISGFCNAGFSTHHNSLYNPQFRYNYYLHIIIAALIFLGSLGFPIILNFQQYINKIFKRKIVSKLTGERILFQQGAINVNTRLVLFMSAVLLIGGAIAFFVFEYNNALQEHRWYGKIITALFGSVTRTAGFNTFETSSLQLPMLLIFILLMWIGGSPSSVAGGIKTSSAAIASLNVFNMVRGENRMEIFGREISAESVRRAFAIIFLSVIGIGVSSFLMIIVEKDKDILAIIFECVSAFCTVGLSMGITSELSQTGKFILIMTMLIGRVGALTLLMAFIRKVSIQKYHYPKEDILIN